LFDIIIICFYIIIYQEILIYNIFHNSNTNYELNSNLDLIKDNSSKDKDIISVFDSNNQTIINKYKDDTD
jgi:hypothetical protein